MTGGVPLSLTVIALQPQDRYIKPMETVWNIDAVANVAVRFGAQFGTAILCGCIVGMEREIYGKPAGLRTSILVCVGAFLFTMAGQELAQLFGGDAVRVAAQIVTGVGFLGAGAILHESGRGITGLTTAAIVWVMAAVGMMIGAGLMLSAVLVSAATVVAILLMGQLEKIIHARRTRAFQFHVHDDSNVLERLEMLVAIHEENIKDFTVQREEKGEYKIAFRFIGSDNERHDFLVMLYELEGIYTGNHMQ